MERLSSPDSLAAVISTSSSADNRPSGGRGGDQGFKSFSDSMEDEGYCFEESGQTAEKKRRLSSDQVKALEKNFEVENKLEPERKVKLAQELGLQPRQVAVWFQNRRARWKTKQLEKEYGFLKANYEALKLSCDSLRQDNEALLAEVAELKGKLQKEDDRMKGICPIKEEGMLLSDSLHNKSPEEINHLSGAASQGPENKASAHLSELSVFSMYKDLKERSSDSDSSVLLQEEYSANGDVSMENLPIQRQQLWRPDEEPVVVSPFPSSLRHECFWTYENPNPKFPANNPKPYHQFIKEEDAGSFFNVDQEPCGLFPDEESSILPWYYSEQWT